ncbi:uncharacterized protein LOC114574911 [Exaiptasia diaphana]|uniref:Tyr recombinase domain-containing protein n=1 Tax=Exaiptasia diaphana TaxID=2652724 RepID=A0A913YJ78_EXADI|nr:uncharacterized protein LOC114574911 [Exaiptasia diaphana]
MYGVCALPANGAHVALYLSELMSQGSSPAPVLSATYGISWAHRKALEPDPCQHPWVPQVCEAAKRLLGRPPVKKENLKVGHVQAIVDQFGYFGTSLADLQTVVIILVGFAGFLRWSDLSGIQVEGMQFHDTHMDIMLGKRKNDQYRKGSMIPIARTGSVYCPVSMMERFIARTNTSTGPLFQEIKIQVGNQKLSHNKLRYSSARSQVLRMFKAIGLEEKKFGLHSLRAGGASAASEAGIPERLISAHGGWKSESSRNGYIRDNKQTRVSVSKALGL